MQIEVVLATRDALLKQREELETKAKQQTQEQSDIYQYLRKKLKDNYVAIAELEAKVRHRARTYTRTFSRISMVQGCRQSVSLLHARIGVPTLVTCYGGTVAPLFTRCFRFYWVLATVWVLKRVVHIFEATTWM